VVGVFQQLSEIAWFIQFIRHTPTIVGVFFVPADADNGLKSPTPEHPMSHEQYHYKYYEVK
jgi:hypothetical protein